MTNEEISRAIIELLKEADHAAYKKEVGNHDEALTGRLLELARTSNWLEVAQLIQTSRMLDMMEAMLRKMQDMECRLKTLESLAQDKR